MTITFDEHVLSYYNSSKSKFILPSGIFKVYIELNARDLKSPIDVTIS